MRISYVYAFLAILFFALSDIGSRISVSLLDVSPIYFGTIQMFLGAIMLYIFSFGAETRLKALKVWHNWAVGVIELSIVIILVFLFQLISAGEASFMQRISVITVNICAFIAFRRKFDKADILPQAFILLSVGLLTYNLPESVRLKAFLLVLYIALANSVLMLITEKNPINHRDLPRKDRLRLTSIVMAVSALLVITITLSLDYYGQLLPDSISIPLKESLNFAQVDLTIPTLVSATLLGAFIYGPALYFYFVAASRITANEILMCFAIAPYIVFTLEFLLGAFNVLEKGSLSFYDALIGSIGSGAALYMAYRKHNSKDK